MSDDENNDNVVDMKKQGERLKKIKESRNNPEDMQKLVDEIEKLKTTIKILKKGMAAGLVEDKLIDYFCQTGDFRRQIYMPADLHYDQCFPVYFYRADERSGTRIVKYYAKTKTYSELSKERLQGEISHEVRKFAVESEPFRVYALAQTQIVKLANRLMECGNRIGEWPKPAGFKSQEGKFFFRHDFDPTPNATLEKCPFIASVLARMSDSNAFCLRVGSLLDYEADRKQALILYGPTDGGKGQIMRLLEFIVGPGGVAVQNAASFASAHGTQDLVDKRLVVMDEADPRFWSTDTFKTFTGRTIHRVNPKGQAVFTAEMHGMIVASTNNPPSIKNDPSLKNRMIFIHVDSIPDGEKLNEGEVERRYRSELPDFLGYCSGLYEDLKATGSTRIVSDTHALDDVVDENEETESFLFQTYFEIDLSLDADKMSVTTAQFQQVWNKICRDYPELTNWTNGGVSLQKFRSYVKSATGRHSDSFSKIKRVDKHTTTRFIPYIRILK